MIQDSSDNKIFTGYRVIGDKILFDGDEIAVVIEDGAEPRVGKIKWSNEKRDWVVWFPSSTYVVLSELKGIERVG